MRGRTRNRQSGVTLVELMISLLLLSFVVAGVLSVAVTMTNGFREQRQTIQNEDAVRTLMEFIGDAARGASPAVQTGARVELVGGTPTQTGDIEDLATCTRGAIIVTNSTSGPDTLEMVYASGGAVTSLKAAYGGGGTASDTSITVNDASNLSIGDAVLITDLAVGHLVRITAVDTATGVVGVVAGSCALQKFPSTGYAVGSLVIRASKATISVGTFDGVANVLLLDPDGSGPATAQPLADNVEDFQVAVGIDVDNSGGIDVGEWAFTPGLGLLIGLTPPTQIRALRVTVVSRSAKPLSGANNPFYRPEAEDHLGAVVNDGYRRRSLTSTFEVRNLGGSP